MGNHEYCPNCEEDDFHYGSSCDPKKVAARLKKEADKEADRKHCVAKMSSFFNQIGLEFQVNEYGTATVYPWQFRNRTFPP